MISHHLVIFVNNDEILHQTPLQEFSNLRQCIQHLIDESQSDDDDDDEFDNPLSEENLMLQTNWKFIKYVIHNKHSTTPKQLKKKAIEQIIKVKPHEKLDTDEGESAKDEEESTTSTELSEENSMSDAPTEATEESKPIETSQVHTVFSKSTCDEDDSSHNKPVTEFEPPIENGEQNIVQENKLLSTNLTVQKVEGLITYSLD